MKRNPNKPDSKLNIEGTRIFFALASIMLAFFAVISLRLIGQSQQLFIWTAAIWFSAIVLLLLFLLIKKITIYKRAQWLKLQMWRVFSILVILLTGLPIIPATNAAAAPQETVLDVSEVTASHFKVDNNLNPQLSDYTSGITLNSASISSDSNSDDAGVSEILDDSINYSSPTIQADGPGSPTNLDGIVSSSSLSSQLQQPLQQTSISAGSLIIPMDTTYQNLGMWKAFGLLYRLLQNGIPIQWAIKDRSN
jgi:hypothetical protein